MNRRDFIKILGQTAFSIPLVNAPLSLASNNNLSQSRTIEREKPILVVVELSGGNDGLNTIVPFADDNYYRLRPKIGILERELLELDDTFGFNPGLRGMQSLWREGELAIIHGCGYAQPSFSHFTSMAYWHTATPNSGNEYGWLGRTADTISGKRSSDLIVQVGNQQSLVVNSANHTPVVFDEPSRFLKDSSGADYEIPSPESTASAPNKNSYNYLMRVAQSAKTSSERIQQAWSAYQTEVDYGILPMDLPKVAACIEAGYPAQLYHVAFRNNSFDTHVQQPALHRRLLSYASDAITGFVRDLKQKAIDQNVVVLIHSEFGRRAGENANLGTDHGTANIMFLAGTNIKGGHYGENPSLKDISINENVEFTTDFRRVYASILENWLRLDQVAVLDSKFETFNMFAS